ncbi:glycoside hydrolase family 5 protein [bacterium]
MKKRLIIPLVLFITCCPRFCPLAKHLSPKTDHTPVTQHGQLSVEGTLLVDKEKNPVVLRGVSLGWHNWWPQYWNADVIKWLRDDWKCTVIRAAMGVEPSNAYLETPEHATALMKTVVEACIEQGIYVIIDWHDHHAEENTKEARAFFNEMAKAYGHHPNIIYEIYNEPTRQDWTIVKAYSDTLISTIRQYDPDNIILIGSPHWDQDVHIAADDPINGYENLMYTMHFYAVTHRQWLRDRGDYALSKGIPLFVSEMDGCNSSGQGELDMEEWNRWIDWMEKNKISWIKWAIADKEETCAALKPDADTKGGWALEELTESGMKARELIRQLNR